MNRSVEDNGSEIAIAGILTVERPRQICGLELPEEVLQGVQAWHLVRALRLQVQGVTFGDDSFKKWINSEQCYAVNRSMLCQNSELSSWLVKAVEWPQKTSGYSPLSTKIVCSFWIVSILQASSLIQIQLPSDMSGQLLFSATLPPSFPHACNPHARPS